MLNFIITEMYILIILVPFISSIFKYLVIYFNLQ